MVSHRLMVCQEFRLDDLSWTDVRWYVWSSNQMVSNRLRSDGLSGVQTRWSLID